MELTNVIPIEDIEYAAATALIVYRAQQGAARASHSVPAAYVTVHSIRDNAVCEGRPASRREIQDLCACVLPLVGDELHYLPDRVIGYCQAENRLVWWSPARVRHLFFHANTGIRSGRAPVPAVLFHYKDREINVFALKKSSRPTPDTVLYNPPFFNGTCMGNVKVPAQAAPGDFAKLEDLYFQSAFTESHAPDLEGTDGAALWKSLVGSGRKRFPTECLQKWGTLKELFARRYL